MAHLQLVKQTSSGLLLPATPESGDFLRSVKIGEWIHADFKRVRNYACKRAARTVLTGMCYSVGSATRQGSSSPTRFIGQSAMTSRT